MSMLTRALAIANEAHFYQLDKGGSAYILHPLRIMMRLNTKDDELMCIALLHDVVEDGNFTFEHLEEAGMSGRVVEALKLLTKEQGMSYEGYIDRMKNNLDALLVKREDLRDNSDITRLKGISQKDVDRMRKYMLAFKTVEQYIENHK